MKTIKYWNTFAIGLPIILLFLGCLDEVFLFYAAISTMLTGLIQIVLGLKMLFEDPSNKSLQLYAGSVGLFFFTWIINARFNYIDIITYILLPIPFILTVYLSVIIYNTKN
ncbi:MAG: hypothetical protein CMP76_11000 [Flavobacterium sp.]|uniref:hypothetical protein n=1 Tax=Flavobacterium sp. TaxID=239 RepID=UPI000C38F0E3|nr:hypothetical protein [Flavobacterium sp.]MBF03812.1 hypothetical protein [Flavobacterium sp.]|tara:strand:+ start:1858 stop:2190 length:333 start_codon:yes stop_codon:yes gene_type:complete